MLTGYFTGSNLFVNKPVGVAQQECYGAQTWCTSGCPAYIALDVPPADLQRFKAEFDTGMPQNVDTLPDAGYPDVAVYKGQQPTTGQFLRMCTGCLVETVQ